MQHQSPWSVMRLHWRLGELELDSARRTLLHETKRLGLGGRGWLCAKLCAKVSALELPRAS